MVRCSFNLEKLLKLLTVFLQLFCSVIDMAKFSTNVVFFVLPFNKY